ncbi:MAG: hypothetical protein FWE82_03435, partial [Defluviitaleaceae bacterium]|nr:hypothetical protein [Defluviitaleaceae bacterium]
LFFYVNLPDDLLDRQSINRLENFYEFIDRDPDVDGNDFLSDILSAYSVDGMLPLLPVNIRFDGISINKNLFEHNRSLENFASQKTTNAEDLVRLHDSLGRTDCGVYEGFNFYDSVVRSRASFIDVIKGSCNFDTPAFRVLAEFSKRNEKRDDLKRTFTGSANYNLIETDEKMSRDYMFVISNDFYPPYLFDTEGVLNFTGMVPLTDLDGRLNVFMHMVFGISAHSKNKDFAWELVKYYLLPEKELPQLTGMMSAYNPMLISSAEESLEGYIMFMSDSNRYLDPKQIDVYLGRIIEYYKMLDEIPFYYCHFQAAYDESHLNTIFNAIYMFLYESDFMQIKETDELIERIELEINETFEDDE